LEVLEIERGVVRQQFDREFEIAGEAFVGYQLVDQQFGSWPVVMGL
jgi:hypothetical protein